MNKFVTSVLTIAIIVGGGAFLGGMQYAESNPPAGGPAGQFSREDFQNLSSEERQQRFQELGANVSGAFGGDHEGDGGFRGGRFGFGTGAQSLSGEVISQSNDSLTIKLSDGSTKIVFVTDSTQISKSVDGVLGDLNEGEQIFVSGDENPDGSYTAQSIQLGSFDHISN